MNRAGSLPLWMAAACLGVLLGGAATAFAQERQTPPQAEAPSEREPMFLWMDHDGGYVDRGLAQLGDIDREALKDELDAAHLALKAAEEADGSSLEAGSAMRRLALAYRKQGHNAAADSLLQRALDITQQVRGPEHPDVARALAELATLYQTQGKYAQAESLYRRALDIDQQAFDAGHSVIEEDVRNFASLYRTQTLYDSAQVLNNLAFLYHVRGEITEADRYYREAFDILKRIVVPEHPELALSMQNLAGISIAEGRDSDAERLYRRAIAFWEQGQADHPHMANSLTGLAALYRRQQRYVEAKPLYARALAIVESALGPDDPALARVLEGYQRLLTAMGDAEAAGRMQARAARIREQPFPTAQRAGIWRHEPTFSPQQ